MVVQSSAGKLPSATDDLPLCPPNSSSVLLRKLCAHSQPLGDLFLPVNVLFRPPFDPVLSSVPE